MITVVEEGWECVCGFKAQTDGGAYNHFMDSNKNNASGAPTDITGEEIEVAGR